MAFIFVSLLFSVGLNILYFSKQHVKNYETKLFSIFLPSNIVGLLLELFCSLSISFFGIDSFISLCLSKLFLVYLLFFGLLLILYVYIICGSTETVIELDAKQRKVVVFFIFLIIICSFITLLLPIELKNSNGAMYSSGMATTFVFIVSALASLYCVGKFAFNLKIIKKRKSIPLIVYIVGAGIMTFIQQNFPEFTIATSMETFVIFLMYNTIENPDIKLIQELEIAKETADKANDSKTEFLSSMSHEIRTPLNAIVGFSDCIMDAKSIDEAKENAKDIVNASQTLLEIVNGILDISKIEAGKMEIVNTRYNAKETFLELAKLITPRMLEKGLDFTYSIDPNLPAALYGDKANLKKIVTNFLSNACKYTDRGYVRYEVHCVRLGDYCRLIISVEDSGRGIKKDSIDKLFTRFQRLDEDRNTTIEGTGLGLAITKQLTELMGGKVIVHTVFGVGSKFTAVINQKIEEVETLEEESAHTSLDLKGVRILIVDDAPLNLKVASKLFQKYNADCIDTCSSGFECLEKIKEGNEYDLLFLDDMMPKMSGVETFSKLKENPDYHIPTIALTANAITGMREKYLAVGFDDYLAKPMEQTELIRVCNILLGRSSDKNIPVEKPEKVEDSEKNEIIPVEENIEEIIGDAANMDGPQKETNPPMEEVEVLEDDSDDVDLIPVADISLPSTTPAETSEVYDRAYLEKNGADINHALELLGDMDMYNMTIHDFAEEIDEKWQRIHTYLEQGDMENYAIDVHSLKSDCKYLGFMGLADIAYDHELKSKEKNLDYVREHFKELETEYNKVLTVIKNYVHQNGSHE
ncbi:MAG: response regulator [Bacilli bacterium]|nr:response regulator [Bacilli bacterium]